MTATEISDKIFSGKGGRRGTVYPEKTTEKAIIMSGYGINSESETQ
jgi:hypothetical protein